MMDRCADYDLIHSENDEESMVVVQHILDMWDLVNNRNCMKNPEWVSYTFTNLVYGDNDCISESETDVGSRKMTRTVVDVM